MTVFVILHYLAEESTICCVERIRALDGDAPVVVVDNASPDGSGPRLLEKYRDEEHVTVLLNAENSGFARGNNYGVQYACQTYRPDFVVVMNDDVEITQKDFLQKLEESYERKPFDMLGPDIISMYSGIHQNPKFTNGITLETVRKKRNYVERSCNPVLMYLSSGEKSSDTLYRMSIRRRRRKQGIDSTRESENVVLHGSCVIFSKSFLERRPEPFYGETFMYYEMEILDYLCRKEGLITRYDPELQVLHHQNTATKLQYRSIVRRSQFVANCLLHSLQAAEKLLLEYE